jgi:hypothetical protein
MPLVALVVPFKMIEAPSLINGSRYWTVNTVPRKFTPTIASNVSGVMLPNGSDTDPRPALTKRTSTRP